MKIAIHAGSRIAAMVVVLAAVLASCDGSTTPAPSDAGSYVGRVAASDAFIVVVTNGSDVRAYACDGNAAGSVTMSEWFKGTKSGSTVELTSQSGAARFSATFGSDGVNGTIRLANDSTLSFSAARAEGEAGFYLFKNPRNNEFYWAGWIVLPNGEQRGSVVVGSRTTANTSLNPGTRQAQIPGVGTVTPGRLSNTDVQQGFQGCYPCLNCC